MPIGIFGATTTVELGERVRSGEIAVDLYRPTQLMLWWLSVDLGRAMFQLLVRGGAPLLVGALVFDLKFPSGAITWLAVAVGLVLRHPGELRHPVPGRVVRVLDHRLARHGDTSRWCCRCSSPGRSCRWSCSPAGSASSPGRRRGRRRCRCRSTSGSAATRAGSVSALAFQLGWILVLLLAGQLATSVGDPEGGDPGWLSPAPPGAGAVLDAGRDVDPVVAGLPGVVRADAVQLDADHRDGLRRDRADVQPHRRRSAGSRWRRWRCCTQRPR